jgi:hypothetical protein
MSRMLVPEYILANFDIYGSQEYSDSWVMKLREKEGHEVLNYFSTNAQINAKAE